METIKTTIHAYRYDTRNPEELAAWKELARRLRAQGLTVFESWGGKGHYDFVKPIDGETVELDISDLFDNQWNTKPIGESANGLRVFDWAQDYPIDFDKRIKRGHYLVQTAAMSEVRRNTYKCGYCGAQEPAQKGYVFCPHCIGSPYLEKKDLHLTRMAPVCDTNKPRAALTTAELAHLLPIYKEAQTRGNTERDKARIAKARADVVAECEKKVRNATTKRDGFLWLMDKGLKTDNVIFYEHSGVFSFGWRKPVCAEVVADILEVISEFDYPCEIKCDDGRTLTGNIG